MSDSPKTLDDVVHQQLADAFVRGAKGEKLLRDALRYLAKWRQMRINAGLYVRTGGKVATGPFRGMHFVARSTEGSLAPKLLGTYEHELHPTIEAIVAGSYETIVNIGAAQGYYAIGLALRMPGAQVFAYDIDANAREACRQVAALNKVADRVEIGDVFQPLYFSRFEGRKTVVVCDIEGHERVLIDPARASALAKFDLLVECHDNVTPGLTDEIAARFAATHQVQRIEPSPAAAPVPIQFLLADELDALLQSGNGGKGRHPGCGCARGEGVRWVERSETRASDDRPPFPHPRFAPIFAPWRKCPTGPRKPTRKRKTRRGRRAPRRIGPIRHRWMTRSRTFSIPESRQARPGSARAPVLR